MKEIENIMAFLAAQFRTIGRDGVRSALILWYALCSDRTPFWAKPVIIGALVYLLSPLDAFPDILPMGFSDDLAVLYAVAMEISVCVDDEVVEKAEATCRDWFGF